METVEQVEAPEVTMRPMASSDLDAVISACERSEGNWTADAFQEDPERPKYCAVIETSEGQPIIFVRFQKSLRIACVWNDATDRARNVQAVKVGLREAVLLAKTNGFTEILVLATNTNLRNFLVSECGMQVANGEELVIVL